MRAELRSITCGVLAVPWEERSSCEVGEASEEEILPGP